MLYCTDSGKFADRLKAMMSDDQFQQPHNIILTYKKNSADIKSI